ncbi:MAG: prolyl oligopeptidase family serine peptidase, partial [Treponema sp.]|nr:prolyl oligopeptidase family serine peptidase [Treponema sp.]
NNYYSGDNMTYDQVVEILDFGPSVTKLIMGIGKKRTALPIDISAFSVQVSRYDSRIAVQAADKTGKKPVVKKGKSAAGLVGQGERKVSDAYVSDGKGNRADAGQFLTLELVSSPEDSLCSPINYDENRIIWIECKYTIITKKSIPGIPSFRADVLKKTYRPQIEIFNLSGKFSCKDREYGKMNFRYADFRPAGAHKDSNLPLIIWLHGWAEGGKDPSLPLAGNKACVFAFPEVQKIFGGAYVLVPQSPTFWMDAGRRSKKAAGDPQYGLDKNTSKYTRALKALIDEYVEKNPGIDRKRIYIGGLSNGGFMTQVLILEYPDFFAAAIPVCSPALDSRISDDLLKPVLKLPTWYVNAATDPVVPAVKHSLATYDRMIKSGAPNVYYSYLRDVRDLSGTWKNRDGSNYEYGGHSAWIYVYNNWIHEEIGGKDTRILEWLSAQKKK